MNHRGTETQRDQLTELVIGCAIDVHRHLGPGLLESAYETCLAWELEQNNLSVARQLSLPVRYKSIELDCGYRIDLLVEKRFVLELKAIERILPIHEAQLLTYLKLGGYRTGLILNFHSKVLKDGIVRRVL
ncbi:MAG: GxxExxY protein [Planctomycetota bacterium]